jgi:hypothetical protein
MLEMLISELMTQLFDEKNVAVKDHFSANLKSLIRKIATLQNDMQDMFQE